MSSTPMQPSDPSSSSSQHITTISHDGRFWDVYLDFEDDPRRPESYRGFLEFSPADGEEDDDPPVRTAAIIIEASYEEAVRKARSFEDHQLAALLRSAHP